MKREYSDHIPCDPNTPCKLRDTIGCYEDIHHEAYPRRKYRTALERKFRDHVLNKVLICRAIHDEEHAQWLIPTKPTVEEMRKVIGDDGTMEITA